MNLTTDPWIPVVWMDAKPAMVGLNEAFQRGHEIQDLAVRPHERIALMRLLICIAQAALDGPADDDDWEACRPRIAPAVLDYLNRWGHAFELFGDGQRFLQIANLKKPPTKTGSDDDEGNSASKLDLALATGNNSTLFDNAGGSARALGEGQLALTLLTFQCFSPSGTIGVALWNGNPTLGWVGYPKPKPGKSSHAPCLSGNMLHSYLRGSNLIESVHSNLLTKEQSDSFCGPDRWGMPVWGRMPSSPTDESAAGNASLTYLGRLVPLSRAIRLADDRQTMTLANGLEYLAYPVWRDPSATIVRSYSKVKLDRVVLPASVEKGTWRELPALTVIAVDKSTSGGPAALQHCSNDAGFDVWVGGLIASGNNKVVDTIESVFHVPATMMTDVGQRTYEEGVKHAEGWAKRLNEAVSACHRELGDNLDRREMRDRRRQVQEKATSHFWTDIEQDVARLLEVTAAPESLGSNAEWHGTPWGRSVRRAAGAAYERACPRGTPRQIHAYVLGREMLFPAPAEQSGVRMKKGD